MQSTLKCVRCAQFSGFMPRDQTYAQQLGSGGHDKIALPTLLVHGEADELVPLERGKQLAASFSAGSLQMHGGAHCVPTCSGQVKSMIINFLDSMECGGPPLIQPPDA